MASWQNLFIAYANNKDADQPAHPCSQISAFIVRCLDSLIPILAISGLKSLASFCSYTDRFESCLVAKPRRQVFSWRGSFQKYFSHIRTMEEFKWMALCNEGLFRFGWNWDLNVWACGTKSGDLISRLQFVKVTTLAICWLNQLNKIDVKHFNQSFKYLSECKLMAQVLENSDSYRCLWRSPCVKVYSRAANSSIYTIQCRWRKIPPFYFSPWWTAFFSGRNSGKFLQEIPVFLPEILRFCL